MGMAVTVTVTGQVVRVAGLGGEGVVSADEAARLGEALLDAAACLRRGRMASESWGWCCVCGRELVNVAEGCDTCGVCLGLEGGRR